MELRKHVLLLHSTPVYEIGYYYKGMMYNNPLIFSVILFLMCLQFKVTDKDY